MTYQNVLFDFDGTVMNSGPGIMQCVVDVAERFHLPVPDEKVLRKFVGPPIKLSFINSFGVSPKQADEMVAYYRERHNETNAWINGHVYDGMEELLKKLNDEGINCAVASVKRRYTVHETLEHFHLLSYFKAVCGGVEGKLPDKAEIIEECLELLNVNSLSSVVMVGDSDYDAVGAKQVGIDFCAVLWGFGFESEQDLAGMDCKYIAKDIPMLAEFLSK